MQGVDITFTVCLLVCVFLCVFVRLRISPPRIKLAASNFARRFIGFQGKGMINFCELCSPTEARNRTNRPERHHLHDVHNDYHSASEHTIARRVDVGSAGVDIL